MLEAEQGPDHAERSRGVSQGVAVGGP